MILLTDVIKNVVLTKLSGTNFQMIFDTDSTVSGINTPLNRAIASINTALHKLHTRFKLKERSVAVKLYPMISLYMLTSAYAMTNTAETNKNIRYIRDTPLNKFTDDIIKIISVTSDSGLLYDINRGGHGDSIYIPNPTTLQITDKIKTDYISVEYQANHQLIPFMDSLPQTSDYFIDVHPSLLEAFYCYTASECLNSIDTQLGIAKKQLLLEQYENICLHVEMKDPINQSGTAFNIKPDLGGWK